MKIAIIGTRGVPARYGGFETCAEELGQRLVRDGHEVHVYCRSRYYEHKPDEYLGMRLVYLPGLNLKYMDTLSHTFLALLHASGKKFDVLLVVNAANGFLLFLPLLFGKKVVLNVDGLEWQRDKWNKLGKTYYKMAARVGTWLSNILVADSREIQRYYLDVFGKKTEFIPYGADVQSSRDASVLSRLGLEPGEYFLQVTRFEPENNPLLSLQAFRRVQTRKKFVLVGGAKYPSIYSQQIASTEDERVLFPGFIYDRAVLRELRANCLAYVHGNEAGGTNPGLLQAMGASCFVISRDVVFNREVLRDAGIFFRKDPGDLASKMRWVLEHPSELQSFREKAAAIIDDQYSWDDVTRTYEKAFRRLLRKS